MTKSILQGVSLKFLDKKVLVGSLAEERTQSFDCDSTSKLQNFLASACHQKTKQPQSSSCLLVVLPGVLMELGCSQGLDLEQRGSCHSPDPH